MNNDNHTLIEKQRQYQMRIDDLLTQHLDTLPEHADRLKAAMRYAVLNGGKRMRPFLTYATGEMLGVHLQELDYVAAAIECIHAYSLIHDDLPAMDDDDLRRGNPTCHIAFDEATAILAGDALQTMAFEILANAKLTVQKPHINLELIKKLSGASGYRGMCGGQAMDLAATNTNVERDYLQKLHELKTGALLEVAVSMAATLADKVSSQDVLHLRTFSAALGLAFQVQDDILDVIGDSKVLGKPQGSDQAHNKSTYPALLGLAGAQDYLQQLQKQALHALHALPYNTGLLEQFTRYIAQRDH